MNREGDNGDFYRGGITQRCNINGGDTSWVARADVTGVARMGGTSARVSRNTLLAQKIISGAFAARSLAANIAFAAQRLIIRAACSHAHPLSRTLRDACCVCSFILPPRRTCCIATNSGASIKKNKTTGAGIERDKQWLVGKISQKENEHLMAKT
jgi:hypothetical protein